MIKNDSQFFCEVIPLAPLCVFAPNYITLFSKSINTKLFVRSNGALMWDNFSKYCRSKEGYVWKIIFACVNFVKDAMLS